MEEDHQCLGMAAFALAIECLDLLIYFCDILDIGATLLDAAIL